MTLDVSSLQGADVVDKDGSKIGSVGQVYLDDRTNEPTFATVKTGLFGTKETFVPLSQARSGADGIQVPYTKDYVKDAPNIDAEGHLEETQQAEIYRYYQLDSTSHSGTDGDRDTRGGGVAGDDRAAGVAGSRGPGGVDGGVDGDRRGVDDDRTGAAGTAGVGDVIDGDERRGVADGNDRQDVAGQRGTVGQDDDASVTLREEELKVGKERVQTGSARLRKYVVTEHQTVTVPVEREEVEVVREPIAGRQSGGQIGEDEVGVTLSEERVVVDKEVVDKERVGLRTKTVTGEQDVEADVRHEEIEVDQQADPTQGRGDTPRR